MPNKTIYVSDSDIALFDEAKEIAGEALSSVISRALKEYVARNTKKQQGMREISIKVGKTSAEREIRFAGLKIGDWSGFSDDRQWLLSATIYGTQKGKWAIYVVTNSKASVLTDRKAWKKNGDYLIDVRKSELLIGETENDFKNKIPKELYSLFVSLTQKEELPIEYLDI